MADTTKQPPSLADLKKLRKPIAKVNEVHIQRLNRLERLALWITNHVGSMGFFLVILTWTVLWLGYNTLAPASARFDPFPAFVLWLFISNMIQIFLMPLIMIGQNLQSRHSEVRAESEYEMNVRSAREIEAILQHLEYQNTALQELTKHAKQ